MSTFETRDGRTWRLSGRKPWFFKRSWSWGEVLLWRSECVECGAPIEVQTPVRFVNSRAFATKRCSRHKRPVR